jgi:hypothetical protein
MFPRSKNNRVEYVYLGLHCFSRSRKVGINVNHSKMPVIRLATNQKIATKNKPNQALPQLSSRQRRVPQWNKESHSPDPLHEQYQEAIQTEKDAEMMHAFYIGVYSALLAMGQHWHDEGARLHISFAEKRIFARERDRILQALETAEADFKTSEALLQEKKADTQRRELGLRARGLGPCLCSGSSLSRIGGASPGGDDNCREEARTPLSRLEQERAGCEDRCAELDDIGESY